MKANLLFLLLFAALLSGCVQTYRVIHSGTITIQTEDGNGIFGLEGHPIPDISEWIDNDGGTITFTPGSKTVFARTPDDVTNVIIGDPGFETITFEGGPGVDVVREDDSWIIISTTPPENVSDSIYQLAPSELRAERCRHKNATTFLIGDRLSCHCPNCGMKFNGPCEN